MKLKYQSQGLQDRFVAKLLNYKRDGYFVDIGSCDALSTNNSYCFEELGWKGICIEMDPQYTDSYKQRTCIHVEADATKLDYEKLFADNNMPTFIDYLSLDVDAASTEVLKILPFDKYTFGVITIEHDFYIHGTRYRDVQRELLDMNYILLCGDVLVPKSHDTTENSSFEDWYVHESIMTGDTNRLMCTHKYPSEILQLF